jgi:hypothetical protein
MIRCDCQAVRQDLYGRIEFPAFGVVGRQVEGFVECHFGHPFSAASRELQISTGFDPRPLSMSGAAQSVANNDYDYVRRTRLGSQN